MVIGIGEVLNNKQLPKDSREETRDNRIPIGSVDVLADELVGEYANPNYRKWYCKVIYTYGAAQVNEWRNRAREGKDPARLFSKYVKDAQTFRSSRSVQNG